MELKKVNIQNKGMSQDYSISKDNQEYAFKNKNVRIQALDDGTLLSVTNIKGPKKIPVDVHIEGIVVGKCYTGNYLVLFTCSKDRVSINDVYSESTKKQHLNYIYRIDLRKINNIKVNLLYSGYLGFELDRTFDTTFYYENANIQKVYWTEEWYSDEKLRELENDNPDNTYINNSPRVINIITEGEIQGKGFTPYTTNEFDFYPDIDCIPQIDVEKDYNISSQHPSGLIQYFTSYYFYNGAETLITSNSDTFTIGHLNKGAKADELGSHGFKITVKNVDHKFDFIRLYSVIRTSKDGPAVVKIVGDIKINKNNPNAQYNIVDTGINQETLSPGQLFFIGGTPLCAKTLEQKSDALFLGNIKTPNYAVPNSIQEIIKNRKIYYYKVTNYKKELITVPFKYSENSPTKYCTTLQSYEQLFGNTPEDLIVPDSFYTEDDSRTPEYDSKNNRGNAMSSRGGVVETSNNEQVTGITKQEFYSRFYNECSINPDDFDIVIGESYNLKKVESLDVDFTRYNSVDNTKNKYSEEYYKSISSDKNDFSKFYNYSLQTKEGSYKYKTFKGGELYRFGIQFQTSKGKWTDVIWLGDKECDTYPMVDNDNHQIHLNNAIYQIPEALKKECKKLGFKNYRIVIANPENQNGRRVQAQGIVCPTLFSPGKRALGEAYSISSWNMRPRGLACAHHHFEPITSALADKGGEIFGFDIGKPTVRDGVVYNGVDYPGQNSSTIGGKDYNSPYYFTNTDLEGTDYKTSNSPKYLITQVSIHSGHKLALKAVEVASDYAGNNFYNTDTGQYDYTYPKKEDGSMDALIYDKNYGVGGWDKIYSDLVEEYKKRGWDIRNILTANTLKKIAQKQFWGEFLTIATLIAGVLIAAGITIVTSTTGVLGGGIGMLLIYIGGMTGATSTIVGAIAKVWGDYIGKAKKEWQKELLQKGFVQIETTASNKQESGKEIFGESNGQYLLPKEFASPGLNVGQENDGYKWNDQGNTVNAVHFISIKSISHKKYDTTEIENEYNRFYVDESIVTFHSPDIQNCRDKNLKLKIVGTAPIDALYSNLEIKTSTPPYIEQGGIDKVDIFSNYRKVADNITNIDTVLSSDFIYWDGQLNNDGNGGKDYFVTDATLYKVFMWDKSSSITGGRKEDLIGSGSGEAIGESLPSILQSKTVFNQLNSFSTKYFNNPEACVIYNNPSKVKLFNSEDGLDQVINTKNNILLYKGNYDHLLTYKSAITSHIEYTSGGKPLEAGPTLTLGPRNPQTVRIKYNSTSHAVLDLNADAKNKKYLLPCIGNEIPYKEGNINGKNCDTHEWFQGDEENKKHVDTCWTSDDEWFANDAYFTLIFCNKSVETEQDVLNLMKEDRRLVHLNNLQESCKNNKVVCVGIISVNTGTQDASISKKIINEVKKDALKFGLIKANSDIGNITINGVRYKVSISSYKKFILTDITLKEEVSNGEVVSNSVSSIKGYFSNDYNDYVYLYEGSPDKGRFQYKTSDNSRHTYIGLYTYIDFPIKYEQPIISDDFIDSYKYLLIGELYYDLEPYELYNGFNNLENLLWYPISKTTPIDYNIVNTEGDTYYQRWDCLKTYPTTTEDETNKVVDIASVMVESRINLDQRTDSNRDFYNIMSRPENFNLFNPVYDTSSNLFQYTIQNNITPTEYTNQVVWSLKRNFSAKVDSWTNIDLSSVVNSRNTVTKIKNFNNSLLLLSDYSIDRINYDEKNFVATDTEYIELANSSKVNGIVQMFSTFGTHNQSTLITEKGFYFIDDNEKSIIRISVDGSINKLAAGKMDSWFKNNVVEGTFTNTNNKALHLEYDPIHKDIYIINSKDCLIYNENLEAFTSFVDYQDCYTLFNCSGSLLALSYNTPEIYEMFEGQYNTTFNDVPIDYSVQYRVNPSPYTDKVFTNVEFIADCSNVDSTLKVGYTPFDNIQVWNEYQDTLVKPLVFEKHRPSNLKQKFRIWRADIPRDANSNWGRDRIRNPWINMTLSKKTNGDNYKLELHSMNVQYME